jgi:predicted AAA+ superfamily ATPase
MSFREFLGLRQSRIKKRWEDDSYSLTEYSFLYSIKKPYDELRSFKSFESFGKQLVRKKGEISIRMNLGMTLLNQYMEKGGFPGVYRYEDLNTIYRYLNQDVLERVTAQDIPQIAEVRDIRLLQTLILKVAQHSGSVFSYRNLAAESGVRSETIRNYLIYLSSAFLVWELWQFRKAEMAKLKANKKFYICDLGLRHAVLKYSPEKIFSPEEKGIEAETLVFNHLRSPGEKISFWRKGNYEVDFVIDQFGFIFPLEVKFRKNIGQDDLEAMREFLSRYQLDGGIVVTESLFDYQGGIIFIPLWLFLLVC